MPKYLLRAAAGAILLSLSVTGCGTPSAGAGPQAAVTVGVLPGADLAPLYLGIEEGFFAQQGIDLTVNSLAPSVAGIVSAVDAGSYDFGYADILSIFTAVEGGADVAIVSGATATSGNILGDFTALMVPGQSDATTLADLEGRTIGVDALGSTNHVVLQAVLEQEGVDPSSIDWQVAAFLDAPEALAEGAVDAALMVEPFATAARIDGMRVVTYPHAQFDQSLTVSGFFAARSTITDDPELAERFAAAVAESLSFASEHQTATRDHIANTLAAQSQVRTRVHLPTFAPTIDRGALEHLAESAVSFGVLAKLPSFDEVLPAT